jgi:hypothetical protein
MRAWQRSPSGPACPRRRRGGSTTSAAPRARAWRVSACRTTHAEAALNHISGRPALARVYDRHDYQREAIAALTTWQAFVAGLVGDGAEVVALAERRRATLVDAG